MTSKADDSLDVRAKRSRLRRSLAIATVLYVLDAFVLNQGVVAVLAALVVTVLRLPRAALALARRDWAAARIHAVAAGIYLVMAAAVLGTNYMNNQLAHHRADMVIGAIRQYEVPHRRLPDRLEELVPDFLPSVPRAKYTLVFNSFLYLASPNRHSLVWITFPPFGRVTYNFEDDRWGHLD
jgi:hypothetical protein